MQILCCAGLVHLCIFIEGMKPCNMPLLPRSVDMEVWDIFRSLSLHIMLYPNRYSSALFVCSRTPSHSLHDGGFAANLRAASISSPALNRGPQSGNSMPDEEQAIAWEKLPIYSVEKALFASKHDNVAERSKAVRSGRIPKGREFKSHRCQTISFLSAFQG